MTHPENFQWIGQLTSTSGSVYKTTLDQETAVQRIDLDVLEEGELAGFPVAADRGRIAFTLTKEEQPQKLRLLSRIIAMSEGKTEIVSPTGSGADGFGADLALKNHLLLVGYPSWELGGAWLFNLEAPNSEPQRLAVANADLGGSVAISDELVAIGAVGGYPALSESPPPPKTLIYSLKDGSNTIIDGYGELSLDRHILARVHPPDIEEERKARLELFDLKDIATPRLILERGEIERALLQNRLLIIVQKSASGIKLCLKQRLE